MHRHMHSLFPALLCRGLVVSFCLIVFYSRSLSLSLSYRLLPTEPTRASHGNCLQGLEACYNAAREREREREREFWATYEPKLYLRGQTLRHESHRLRYRRHLEALSPVLMDAAYAVVRLCLRTDLSQVPVHFCIKAIPRCAGIPLYRTHTYILVHLHIYIYTHIYIYI